MFNSIFYALILSEYALILTENLTCWWICLSDDTLKPISGFNDLLRIHITRIEIYVGRNNKFESAHEITWGDQRRLRRACASAQSRQSLCCTHKYSMEVDEGSDKNQTSTLLDSCACAFEEWVYGGRKSTIISWDGSILIFQRLRRDHDLWNGRIVRWIEPRLEKTCLRGLRPGITQTGLLRDPS